MIFGFVVLTVRFVSVALIVALGIGVIPIRTAALVSGTAVARFGGISYASRSQSWV